MGSIKKHRDHRINKSWEKKSIIKLCHWYLKWKEGLSLIYNNSWYNEIDELDLNLELKIGVSTNFLSNIIPFGFDIRHFHKMALL